MKQRTRLTLVRNFGLIYPKTDADYDVLLEEGIPVNNLSADFLPALLHHLPSNIKTEIVKFEQLELEMLERFESKWKNEVNITQKAVTLVYNRDTSEALVEKATASLKKWYRVHFYRLEASEKRSGRTIKTILAKVLAPHKET